MSDSNYVPNASNTTQQYEALGPDGNKVTQGPEASTEEFRRTSRWPMGGDLSLLPFKYLPIRPDVQTIPLSNPIADALCNAKNPVADTVMGYGRWPRIPEPSNAFMRSLIATQIWQDSVLREASKK